MRLFSYCIPYDNGAAPNPYWGMCTLTLCKPAIRRNAKVGDWVIGIGSKNVRGLNYSGTLVYAMQVTNVLTLREYDAYCRKYLKEKIPTINSRDYRRQVGDCQYDYDGAKQGRQRRGVHRPGNKARDLRGKNALLSEFFYYFGDNAILIPPKFSLLVRQGRAHQLTKNESIKEAFIEWLTSPFRPNRLYGKPQIQVRFSVTNSSSADRTKIPCGPADEKELCNAK